VPPEGFEAAWEVAGRCEGWLTEQQARVLWDSAHGLMPSATVVEIGSFRGRSTVVLASAAGEGVEVVAIDPHAGSDRGPREISADAERGDSDHNAFLANIERAGVGGIVRHVRRFSDDALGEFDGSVELLWVDGAHRFGPARKDIVRWGARVPEGGRMLVHDAWSSIGVTLALLSSVAFRRGWRYLGRTGSLAIYERGARRNPLRQLAELPWFARNVLVKVALVAHAWPLARLLGHRTREWPY
jgi:hypothetical protein